MAATMTESGVKRDVYTPEEASVLLNVHEVTFRRLLSNGVIPSFRVGASRRIRKDVIEALMNPTCKTQPRPGDWRDADDFIRLLRPDLG
ncbi:MAG: helix-turn-helix domain-containing protein [Chloroflexota bacterium]|nr:helix-turn-helix domain-containing protein [Chloroflexota bacterium]